jgi:hypothetical protein
MLKNLFALVLLSTTAFAELPTGSKRITLKSAVESVEIGTATFEGLGDSRTVAIVMKDGLFKDHFLSMRPFKCLEGVKFYCHLPYPYEWKGVVTEDDLADLEYALLFVQKEPTAYGINLWNGIYYKLALSADGQISGTLHEIDMDTLASPPPGGELRPIKEGMLSKTDANGQRLPEIVIE